MKSTDRAKLKGYCNRWTNAKYVLGCAVFIDLLTPSATFSKTMQSDELDILAATANHKKNREAEVTVTGQVANLFCHIKEYHRRRW